jgi:hypothetical protein
MGSAPTAAVIGCGHGVSKLLLLDGRCSTAKKRSPRIGVMVHRPWRLLASVGKRNSSGRRSKCSRMPRADGGRSRTALSGYSI